MKNIIVSIVIALSILSISVQASEPTLKECVEVTLRVPANPFVVCTDKAMTDLTDEEYDEVVDAILSIVENDPILESGVNQVINTWLMQ